MILSVTLSKPVKNAETLLGRPYLRIKIRANNSSGSIMYFAESFTEKQAFHEQMTESQLSDFLEKHAGKTFRNCVERTETEEITILANKKGEITTLRKPAFNKQTAVNTPAHADGQFLNITSPGLCSRTDTTAGLNHTKNYLLPEGTPVPFLVLLGVMTPEGRVIASRYDKFRQINRFLEFIDDILPEVTKNTGKDKPVRIADFGCGKSYLTFAVHYYLTEIKKIAVEITGLDLKKDVIDYCSRIAGQLGCRGLTFAVGNIAEYTYENEPDVVITLHACDTATDYALDYAVKHNCKAILSVPCCQHELNRQIDENKSGILSEAETPFAPFLKYGIIKERLAALATDALRAEYLENAGYSVQILEFIDMEHTPKNLLIRAVKKSGSSKQQDKTASKEADLLTAALHVSPTLKALLQD
jgi:hypothetical protein